MSRNEIDPNQATRLYYRRKQVAKYNDMKMSELPGEAQVFVAFDNHLHGGGVQSTVGNAHDYADDVDGDHDGPQGINYVYDSIYAVQMLSLKVGSQVLLIKNRSSTLPNGLRGRIVGFEVDKSIDNMEWVEYDDCQTYTHEQIEGIMSHVSQGTFKWPIVEFQKPDGSKALMTIKPDKFTVEDANNAQVMATRFQLPLILGYSLTVHKSQGLTLDKVIVNLSDAFEYGQVYVALSRARRMQDVRLVGGVDMSSLKLADGQVVDFLKNIVFRNITLLPVNSL